jgi:hypothetical protein
MLVITFPPAYDRRVGDGLLAYVRKGDDGQDIASTFIVNDRHLSLLAWEIAAGTSITVTVHNPINPNIRTNTNTGHFRIGIRDQGLKYLAYNNRSGVLETHESPGWAYLQSIEP